MGVDITKEMHLNMQYTWCRPSKLLLSKNSFACYNQVTRDLNGMKLLLGPRSITAFNRKKRIIRTLTTEHLNCAICTYLNISNETVTTQNKNVTTDKFAKPPFLLCMIGYVKTTPHGGVMGAIIELITHQQDCLS